MKFSICAIIVLFALSANAADDLYNQGARALLRVYDECNRAEFGVSACLKKKAINIIDRVARMDTFSVNEGFKVVKNQNAPETKPISENELEMTLPRGIEARDEALTELLVDRIANFFNARTVQIQFPKLNNDELARSLEEGEKSLKVKS
jgi:Protein of unknown function (DUF1676)